MSPRRNRRVETSREGGRPRTTAEAVESWPDGDWVVRSVPAAADGRIFRCPGCDHEIRSSTAHLVCWPYDGGVDQRRHWHRPCWRARNRRAPRTFHPH